MRKISYAILLSIVTSAAAFADENVAGNWHADIGSGVTINMNVMPDGGWSSETLKQNKVVRQMSGTYKQIPSAAEEGTLVFTPTKATAKTGKVQPETDKYVLAEDGKQLKLTSAGDTMTFEKH